MRDYEIKLTAEQLQSIQWLLHENDRQIEQRKVNGETSETLKALKQEYHELYDSISEQVGTYNWAELE